MTDTPPGEEWRDWAEVAAADLEAPNFQALVREVQDDQDAWAARTPGPASAAPPWRRCDVPSGSPRPRWPARTGASQPEISRVERPEDVRISTLQNYLRSLGAHLEVLARFGDGHVLHIDIGELTTPRSPG